MFSVLVAYDISDDHRRNRVAKCLKGYGERVNLSVFECVVKAGTLRRMKSELMELINRKDDSVRIYRLCAECIGKIDILGNGSDGFPRSGVTYV